MTLWIPFVKADYFRTTRQFSLYAHVFFVRFPKTQRCAKHVKCSSFLMVTFVQSLGLANYFFHSSRVSFTISSVHDEFPLATTSSETGGDCVAGAAAFVIVPAVAAAVAAGTTVSVVAVVAAVAATGADDDEEEEDATAVTRFKCCNNFCVDRKIVEVNRPVSSLISFVSFFVNGWFSAERSRFKNVFNISVVESCHMSSILCWVPLVLLDDLDDDTLTSLPLAAGLAAPTAVTDDEGESDTTGADAETNDEVGADASGDAELGVEWATIFELCVSDDDGAEAVDEAADVADDDDVGAAAAAG